MSRSAALRLGGAGASSRQAGSRPTAPAAPDLPEHPKTTVASVVPVVSSPPSGPGALPGARPSPSVAEMARAVGGRPIEPRQAPPTPLSAAPHPGAPPRPPAAAARPLGAALEHPASLAPAPTPTARPPSLPSRPPPPALTSRPPPPASSLPPAPVPPGLVAPSGPPPSDPTSREQLTYGGLSAPQRGLMASLRYTAHVTLYSARRFRLLRELRGDVASKQAQRALRLHELAQAALELGEL